jgi:hypothetical protein
VRRFRVTYRSHLIETDKEHVCEGLEHSDGQVYYRAIPMKSYLNLYKT